MVCVNGMDISHGARKRESIVLGDTYLDLNSLSDT